MTAIGAGVILLALGLTVAAIGIAPPFLGGMVLGAVLTLAGGILWLVCLDRGPRR